MALQVSYNNMVRSSFLTAGMVCRRERRESRLKDEIEKYRIENPKITEQFADIKRKLAEISNDEWEAIPDIGDYSMKNKNKRPQFYSPAPDSLLATAAARNEKDTSIGISSSLDGLKTPAGMHSLSSHHCCCNFVGHRKSGLKVLSIQPMSG